MDEQEYISVQGEFQGWLTAGEAASRAGVSRAAVSLWIHGGRVEAKRVGRWWYIRQTSLVRHLRTRAQTAPLTEGVSHGQTHSNRRRGDTAPKA